MKIKLFVFWLVLMTFIWMTGCAPAGTDPEAIPPMKMEPVIDDPVEISAPAETKSIEMSQTAPTPTQAPTTVDKNEPDALESAQAFMDWYITFLEDNQSPSGEIFYPFEEGLHMQVDFFTEDYLNRVNEILSVPILERGNFDPVMHKWGFVKDFSLELVSLDDHTATIAVEFTSVDLPSWAGATLDLVKKETGWKIDGIRSENIASPAGVTILFYDWYLGYYRAGGNPLQDGAYKASEYLSEAFIQRVSETQAGRDPFVLSSEIPNGGSIMEEPVIRGNKASAFLWRYYYSSQSQPVVVHLDKTNHTWIITDVSLEEAALNPTEVVEAFYGWYLEYTKPDSDGNIQNPLVDQAYQDSPYLSDTFKGKLDQREQGYDPVLCAQDIPTHVTPDGFFVEKVSPPGEARHASIVVRTSFYEHIFTVDLTRPGGSADEWKIEQVVCSFSPEGTVKAFYTWYQGCIEGSATCRTPHAGEAYPATGLVTERFVEQVEALREEYARSGGGGYDPIMMAQEYYFDFDVQKVFESSGETGSGKARVFLRNLSRVGQGAGEEGLLVTLVVDRPFWKIDNVTDYFENTPEQIASKFYTWYIHLLRSEWDPQVTYGFEPEAFLSADYMDEVGPALENQSFQNGNPILHSDQLPVKVEVKEAQVEADLASLVVERYFEGQDSPSPMFVSMEKIDGWWVITGAEE